MGKQIATVAELFDVLGVDEAVAQLLNVTQDWINVCRKTGWLPKIHRRAIARALPIDYDLPEFLGDRK